MNDLDRAREILYNWDEWHKAREGLPIEPGALRILRTLLSVAEAANAIVICQDSEGGYRPSPEGFNRLLGTLLELDKNE